MREEDRRNIKFKNVVNLISKTFQKSSAEQDRKKARRRMVTKAC